MAFTDDTYTSEQLKKIYYTVEEFRLLGFELIKLKNKLFLKSFYRLLAEGVILDAIESEESKTICQVLVKNALLDLERDGSLSSLIAKEFLQLEVALSEEFPFESRPLLFHLASEGFDACLQTTKLDLFRKTALGLFLTIPVAFLILDLIGSW